MDFYLQAGNSYQRLEDEFKKYGKLIFCVDFDDTIFDFHKKGRTYDDLIQLLKRWGAIFGSNYFHRKWSRTKSDD